MRRRYLSTLLTGQFMVVALFASAPAMGDSLETLSQELIQLRGEVEDLNARLDSQKDRHKTTMRSLARQKSELDAELKREKLREGKLKTALAKHRQTVEQAGLNDEQLRPVVLQAIDRLEAVVQASLPFKRKERLAELDALKRKVEKGVLPPVRAINQLWAFHEDELRLTHENGIYRQSIPLNGEERLVDVARLGTVMMYFRTDDQQYGKVHNNADGWTFQILDRKEDQERVAHLFDSLEKQIRTGYFELPNALPSPGGTN